MPIEIAGHHVGQGFPCYIIAEAGVNHNGDPKLALQLINAAAHAGVDAVKFQSFHAAQLAAPEAPKAGYQLQTTAPAESQLEMLRRLELKSEDYGPLLVACKRERVTFLSTPFDESSADMLHELGVPAFKVSSGDLTHLPLLQHLATFGKPILLSTGMATLEEVQAALDTIRNTGNNQIVLLHCVSNYPAAPADCNLRAMRTMAEAFHVPVGFSDHTLGTDVALAAVALGANVLEKHFTMDRALPGPDHQASLLPAELAQLVEGARRVEAALGDGRKLPRASEANTAAAARRSLVAAQSIPPNTVLQDHMIAIRRPGTGLAPADKPRLLGRVTREAIPSGTLIHWNHLK